MKKEIVLKQSRGFDSIAARTLSSTLKECQRLDACSWWARASSQSIVTPLIRSVRCLKHLPVLALQKLVASMESESVAKVLVLLKHFFSRWRTYLMLTIVVCLLSDLCLQCIQLSIENEMEKMRGRNLCVCVDE